MSTNGLIKDVSKELKHYYERTRREEGFDMSSAPRLDFDKYKHITLSGSLKSENTFRLKEPKKISSEENFKKDNREEVIKTRLLRALKKSTYESPYKKDVNKQDKFKNKRTRAKSAHSLHTQPKLSQSLNYIPMGLLELRSKPSPYLTKVEKRRIIDTTTKLLTATDDILVKIFRKDDKRYLKSSNTNLTQENLQRFYNQERHLVEYKRAKDEQEREEQFELEKNLASLNTSNCESVIGHSNDNRLSKISKKVELSDTDRSSKTFEDKVESIRPKTSKRPRQILGDVPVQVEQQEDIYDFNNACEITTGPKYKYSIKIDTGSRSGSGTDAHIFIQLYGTKGKTNPIRLDKSLLHIIPFQRGNSDQFEVNAYDVGSLKGIHIGHNKSDVAYSWFLDRVIVEDNLNNLSYEFECNNWIKNDSESKQSTRHILLTRKNTLFPQVEVKETKLKVDYPKEPSRLSLRTNSSQSKKVNRSISSSTTRSESIKASPLTSVRSNVSSSSSSDDTLKKTTPRNSLVIKREIPLKHQSESSDDDTSLPINLNKKLLEESKNSIISAGSSISSDSPVQRQIPLKNYYTRQDTLSDGDDDFDTSLRKATTTTIETSTKKQNNDNDSDSF